MLRILVADTHWIVRRRIANIVATHVDWEVCAEAEGAAETLESARRQALDLAIVAIPMPGLTATELIDGLAEKRADLKVLALSMHEDQRSVEDCLAAGALGCVLKTDSEAKIEAAIAAVGDQRVYFSPRVARILWEADEFRRGMATERLSRREAQITQLVAEGYTNKKIAQALGLSIKTVETHRTTALSKTHMRSGVTLVRYAIKHGLIAG